MPWRKASRPDPAASAAAEQDDAGSRLARAVGSHPCTAHGCEQVTGLPCEYVDRRDRHCRTAWCPAHRVVVEVRVYCRRHAGVVSSLLSLDSSMVVPLPDLDNRAPSLVGWIARQLDGDIWPIMLGELEGDGGGQLVSDPVTLVFSGIERQRAWERAWKLITSDGDQRRVSLLVEEASDSEVAVKVGANVVDRLTPPWIVHRVRGETVDAETDSREREAFNQHILDAMQRGLARERQLAEVTRTQLPRQPAPGAETPSR